MKIRKYILLFICSMISPCLIADNCRSHTFFVPRQITTNSIFELGLNNYHWYHERDIDDEFHFGIYPTLFFQQSAKSQQISRYFLRGEKECLEFHEVNEDPSAIESLWFGLETDVNTNFNATFNMDPRRRAFGSCFNLFFTKRWGNHHVWFNIVFAAMRAEHELRMCENVEELDGPLSNFELGTINEFTSVICALNNPEWCFGKFSECTLKRAGVDDIQVKLGYDWYYSQEDERNHLSPYIVGTIPTGKRQRSEFIFEPVVGSKNGSIGVGINTDVNFCSFEESNLVWLADIKYRFVLGANQCRSFDLCVNGDWSRYLLVVPEDQHLATQPGINLFSLEAKVTPGSTIDFWTALHWQCNSCSFNVEIGYDFWWRQKEKVCIKKCLKSGFGIFDMAGASNVPQSASTANISQGPIGVNKAPSDITFVELTASDLDRDSAAHPNALSSTIYAAFGWGACGACPYQSDHPVLLDFGAQYEFAHNDAALSQWAVWAKLGVIF